MRFEIEILKLSRLLRDCSETFERLPSLLRDFMKEFDLRYFERSPRPLNFLKLLRLLRDYERLLRDFRETFKRLLRDF